MSRLGLAVVACVGLLGPVTTYAQSRTAPSADAPPPAARAGGLIIPPGFDGAREASADRARAPRAHRDLLVPADFGGPASPSQSTSELIVPDVFRGGDAPPSELREPGDRETRELRMSSELRVPAIFQSGGEEAFNPSQIEDGLLVPEVFRSPTPSQPRVFRVRDELQAPGFDPWPAPETRPATSRPSGERPAALRDGSATTTTPAASGLGRRLDSPARPRAGWRDPR